MTEQIDVLQDADNRIHQWLVNGESAVTFNFKDENGAAENITGLFFEGRFSKSDGQSPILVKTLTIDDAPTGVATLKTAKDDFAAEDLGSKIRLEIWETFAGSPVPDPIRRKAFLTEIAAGIPST